MRVPQSPPTHQAGGSEGPEQGALPGRQGGRRIVLLRAHTQGGAAGAALRRADSLPGLGEAQRGGEGLHRGGGAQLRTGEGHRHPGVREGDDGPSMATRRQARVPSPPATPRHSRRCVQCRRRQRQPPGPLNPAWLLCRLAARHPRRDRFPAPLDVPPIRTPARQGPCDARSGESGAGGAALRSPACPALPGVLLRCWGRRTGGRRAAAPPHCPRAAAAAPATLKRCPVAFRPPRALAVPRAGLNTSG